MGKKKAKKKVSAKKRASPKRKASAKRKPSPRKPSLAAFREGVCKIDTYNDGLTVFLYDAAQRVELDDINIGEVVEAHLGVDELELQYRQISDAGRLVAYQLDQDDEISAELAVGVPLSDAERATLGVGPPQHTFLDVPSGELCVESYNSLKLGAFPGEETGVKVQVPPGEYTLSLYQKDFSGWSDSKLERYRGPLQLLILTQTDELSPPEDRHAYLPWLPPAGAPDWVGDWRIDDDGVFHGRFIVPIGINLDRRAAQRMGLRAGMRLRLETDDWNYEAVYLPGVHYQVGSTDVYGPEIETPRLHTGLKPNRQAGVETLELSFVADYGKEEDIRLHGAFIEAWQARIEEPVRIVVQPKPFFPAPDSAALDRWTVDGEILHSEVIISTSDSVILSTDRRAFKAIGAGVGDALLVEIGGMRRTLYYLPTWKDVGELRPALSKAHPSRSFAEEIEDDQPLYGSLDRHWEFRNKYVLWCKPLSGNDTDLDFTVESGTPVTMRRRA